MKSGKLLILIGIIVFNTTYLFSNPANLLNSKANHFESVVAKSFSDVLPPSAPSNLTTYNITQTSVDLYWNASTDDVGVAGYKIYQNGILVKTVSSPATTANIGGLIKSTNYSFVVKAFDFSDNLSEESNTRNITTLGSSDTEPPSPVKNLKVVKVTTKEIILEWGAATDNNAVEKYRVYVNSSIYSNTQSTSVLINGLLPGTYYSITVYAIDNSGNGSSSNTIGVSTLVYTDTQAPSAPSLNSSINGTDVTLQWNNTYDNVGVAAYQIFQNSVLIKTVEGNVNSTAMSGLNSGTSYDFFIKAVDYSNNVSASSNTVNITIPGDDDTEKPTMPTNFSANVVKNNIALQWIASTDNVSVAFYSVFIINLETYSSNQFQTTNTSYLFEGLNPGTLYGFAVGANDPSLNFSGWVYTSATTEGTVDKTDPSMPVNLVAKSITKTEIAFEWDASTDNVGIDKYKVFKDDVFYADVKSTSATVSGLTPGTSYNFNVQAFDFAGNSSSKSYYIYETTKSDVDIIKPSVPRSLHASAIGETDVLLEWDKSMDNIAVHHYCIYKDGVLFGTTSGTGIVVNWLIQNIIYKFYITAVDDAGNTSDLSNEISIRTKATALFEFQTYCTSSGNVQSDEWLDYFGFASIDNYSGGESGGYSNFVQSFNPININPNSTYTLYGRIGYGGFNYDEYLRIWIDYNRDGDFDDAGEQIAEAGPLATSELLEGTFTTPADFVEGPTVLRVSMKYNGYSGPCENFQFGEVEDYPIYLSKTKSLIIEPQLYFANAHNMNIPVQSKFAIFPNPAKDEIGITPIKSNVDISIYSLLGKQLKAVKLNAENRKIDISELKAGSYIIKMDMGGKVITKQFIKE